MKIVTIAEVPDELASEWLQHLRDFDTAHRDCHFQVLGDAPDMTMREIMEMMTINPSLSFFDVLKRRTK